MNNESIETSNQKIYTKKLESEKEKDICKDGFCSIKIPNKNSQINKDDKHFFDPI